MSCSSGIPLPWSPRSPTRHHRSGSAVPGCGVTCARPHRGKNEAAGARSLLPRPFHLPKTQMNSMAQQQQPKNGSSGRGSAPCGLNISENNLDFWGPYQFPARWMCTYRQPEERAPVTVPFWLGISRAKQVTATPGWCDIISISGDRHTLCQGSEGI